MTDRGRTGERLIVCANIPPEPWKNGSGITRTLLTDGDTPWRWRISVADIAADGPFSRYPDTKRWFALTEGAGVALRIDETIHCLDLNAEPRQFSGESVVTCRLRAGPVRDLNLMLRGASGTMERAVANAVYTPRFTGCGLFTIGPARCVTEDGELAMPRFSLAWFSPAPETVRWVVPRKGKSVEHGGSAYWLTVGAEETRAR